MKTITGALLLAMLLPTAANAADDANKGGEPIPKEQSFNLGALMGNQAKINTPGQLDIEQFIKGFKDGYNGKFDQAKLAEFNQSLRTYMTAQQQKLGDAAMEASKKFLDKNAKRKGIKTTESGLQYEVVKKGKGTAPKATDKVTVHYRGTLTNGEEFDSSYSRGEPTSFPLNGVIPGWTEGVQLMKPGAKYKFYIPPQLAYGPRGAPPKIGPNEALIFDIELIKVGE